MKPAAFRKAERELRKIMRDKGDNCSLCGRAYSHNDQTYGGTTRIGKVVLVGDCCREHIKTVVSTGLYLDAEIDSLVRELPAPGAGRADHQATKRP